MERQTQKGIKNHLLVDTSIWIEWLTESLLFAKIKPLFPTQEVCVVPTIVQLELAKWLTRELGEEKSDLVIAYTRQCEVVSLTTEIALLAAEYHRYYKLATADAIIYATAISRNATLLSRPLKTH